MTSANPPFVPLPVRCVDHAPDAREVLTALRHSAAATFAARFPGGLAEFYERVDWPGGSFLAEPPRFHELVEHEALAGRPIGGPVDPAMILPGAGYLFLPDWDDWDPSSEDYPALEAILSLYTPGADAATTLLSVGWIEDNTLDLEAEPPSSDEPTPPGVIPFPRSRRPL